MKRIAAFALAISLIFSLAMSLVGCDDILSDILPDETDYEVAAVVKLDFSPTVMLAINKKNEVVGVSGFNDDAVILLYEPNENESTLVGNKLTAAIKKLVNSAIKYGFINQTYNAVGVSVLSSEFNKSLSIEALASGAIEQACELSGVPSNITTDLSFSAKSAYNSFRDLHSSDSFSWVDEKTFDFAYALSKYNFTSVEDEIEYDEGDMVEKIGEICLSYKNYETTSFRFTKKNADEALERTIAAEVDRLWIERYKSERNAVKGAAYLLFYFDYLNATAEIKSIKQTVDYLHVLEYLVFDSTKTAEILSAFGLTEDDLKLISSRSGNVTVDSVEQYANKLARNGKPFYADEIEEIIASFNRTLSTLKDRYVDEQKSTVEEEIESILKKADSVRLEESDFNLYSNILLFKESFEILVSDGALSYAELDELVTSLEGVSTAIVQTAKSALAGWESDMEIATGNKLAELERPDSAPMLDHNAKVKQAKKEARSWLLTIRSELRAGASEY